MSKSHTLPPADWSLKDSLHKERHLLQNVNVPIVTVSSTFLDAFPETEVRHHTEEIVYSRAHYSQALACLIAAARLNKTAWLIDPTNYVSASDWWKVLLTEKIAETLVRSDLLMKVRQLLENQARNKLPIHNAIDDPLLYVTANITKPILSLHYEAANILADKNFQVLSVVTDPYVRDQYLIYSQKPNVFYAVFDEATKQELIEKSTTICTHSQTPKGEDFCTQCCPNPLDLDKRIFVTGPPIDPRIVDGRKIKNPKQLKDRPLRLAITTGGTGTNKPEILKILKSLLPRLVAKPYTLQVLAYAGTHADFFKMYKDFAKDNHLVAPHDDPSARFRLLYGPYLMDANEGLVKYLFPWADLIITKPSGDMAYDVAASGSACLFLNPLGPWEQAIQRRFEKLNLGLDLGQPDRFADNLLRLEKSWLPQAMTNALKLPSLYLKGAENIVNALKNIQNHGQ